MTDQTHDDARRSSTLMSLLQPLGLSEHEPPDALAWVAFLARLDQALERRERHIERQREAYDQAQRARQAAEQARQASILAALSDGLCVLDDQGRCIMHNEPATRALGLQGHQLDAPSLLSRLRLGPHHGVLTPQEVFERVWLSMTHRLTLEFPEAQILRPERELPVACAISPLIEHDEVIGCVLTLRDTSHVREHERALMALNEELTQARDRALEASQSKSTFLANMSHELRTPLNAIIGYAELVHEDALEDGRDTLAEDARKIRLSANHLLQVINDILDISKIEAGKMELFAETFGLDDLLDQVSATVRPMIERNQNTLVIQRADYLPALHTDKLKLRQSLLNLLSNAAKFTRQGVITLRVALTQDGQRLRLEVEDTGIGIPEDRIDRLFDAFIQADQSTTRQYGGTGLGLSITRQLCLMLGGQVSVTSQPGVGSCFVMEVPTHLPSPALAVLPPSGELPPTQAHERLVLAIDDDATIAELLERFLAKEHLRVVHARSGEEGLRLARELRPEVITLDVMMPHMDGWSVLHALKSDPELSQIPVVMLTIVPDRQRGYALGAVDYLTKPIDRTRLIEVLRRHGQPSGPVLVVEDDEHTRELLRRMLELHDLQVVTTHNGHEALLWLEGTPRALMPAVILLDLMMPLLDGFQVLERLRANPAWEAIPVIVLTARELTIQEITALRERTAQVLQKAGSSPEGVIKAIQRALQGRRVQAP